MRGIWLDEPSYLERGTLLSPVRARETVRKRLLLLKLHLSISQKTISSISLKFYIETCYIAKMRYRMYEIGSIIFWFKKRK